MIQCPSCLIQLAKDDSEPNLHYCKSYNCNKVSRIHLDESLIYYYFTFSRDYTLFFLQGSHFKKITQIYQVHQPQFLLFETSFISFNIHDLPNEINNFINRVFKLKAFL